MNKKDILMQPQFCAKNRTPTQVFVDSFYTFTVYFPNWFFNDLRQQLSHLYTTN